MHIALVLWNPTMQNNITHNLTRGFLSPRDGPVGRGPGGPASWQLDPSWFLKLGKKTPKSSSVGIFQPTISGETSKIASKCHFSLQVFRPFFRSSPALPYLPLLYFIELRRGLCPGKKKCQLVPPSEGRSPLAQANPEPDRSVKLHPAVSEKWNRQKTAKQLQIAINLSWGKNAKLWTNTHRALQVHEGEVHIKNTTSCLAERKKKT